MSDIYGYLIALGALIVGFIAAYFKGKSAAKNEQVKHDYESTKRAKNISNEVDALDNDGVRDSAGRWVRNKKR